MVIAVANQKGGVGKTTLCMHFANYLASKGANLLIVDVDMQKSLVLQRRKDLSAFTDQAPYYLVEEVDIDSVEHSEKMMRKLKGLPGIAILDTPGNVTEDGLIPIFTGADIIICPYKYEQLCLESTGIFLQVVQKLQQRIKEMNPILFFVPNHVDKRIGTDDEKKIWDDADSIFKNYGFVTPRVYYRSELMRANTLFITSTQIKEVQPCFDFIIKNGKIL